MTRIQLNDTVISAAVKMSEGNPGAISVILDCLEKGSGIDPDSAFGGFGAVLALDTHGIYGSRIWLFYKDVCGQDLTMMLAVMRAVQLGMINESEMLTAINEEKPMDCASVLSRVRERLPDFGAVLDTNSTGDFKRNKD